MLPHAEMVHWGFAAGILLVGLCLLAEAVVGQEVWRMRPWRRYLWPGIAFGIGSFPIWKKRLAETFAKASGVRP